MVVSTPCAYGGTLLYPCNAAACMEHWRNAGAHAASVMSIMAFCRLILDSGMFDLRGQWGGGGGDVRRWLAGLPSRHSTKRRVKSSRLALSEPWLSHVLHNYMCSLEALAPIGPVAVLPTPPSSPITAFSNSGRDRSYMKSQCLSPSLWRCSEQRRSTSRSWQALAPNPRFRARARLQPIAPPRI